MSEANYTPNTVIIVGVILFGFVTICLLAMLQNKRFEVTKPDAKWPERFFAEAIKRTRFSVNFLVIVGLICVIVVAAVLTLALANAPSTSLSPAFTLFGTVAGYLATRRLTHPGEDEADRSATDKSAGTTAAANDGQGSSSDPGAKPDGPQPGGIVQ